MKPPSRKILKVFSVKETQYLEKNWIATFCKNKQGTNIKAYKWHIFSSGIYPSIEGKKAKYIYEQQKAPEFIILPNDCNDDEAILINQLPLLYDGQDCYVFPKNMAWTMAFTHEEGWLGAYFAKNKNYKALNLENEKQIEKNRQIKIAKEKGWI